MTIFIILQTVWAIYTARKFDHSRIGEQMLRFRHVAPCYGQIEITIASNAFSAKPTLYLSLARHVQIVSINSKVRIEFMLEFILSDLGSLTHRNY